MVSYFNHGVFRDWHGGVKGDARWLLDTCWDGVQCLISENVIP